jgi:hypothetical protein
MICSAAFGNGFFILETSNALALISFFLLAFSEPFDGGLNEMRKQNPISKERWGSAFWGI